MSGINKTNLPQVQTGHGPSETAPKGKKDVQKASPEGQRANQTDQIKTAAKAPSERTAGLGKSIGRVSGQETFDQIKAAEPGSLSKIEGLSLESEMEALEGLSEKAIPEGVTLENLPEGKDAEWLYNFQMGRIDANGNEVPHPDETEIIRFVKMHNMLPSELLAKSELPRRSADFNDVAWLNQTYVDVFNQIEETPVRETNLFIDQSLLRTLPANISKLTALKELSCPQKGLHTLPPEIGMLASLETLGLASNLLKALPPEIGQLKSLKTLDMPNNDLKILPPEIGQLTALEILDVSGSPLTDMPPAIGQLTSLEWINLERTQLSQETQTEIQSWFEGREAEVDF